MRRLLFCWLVLFCAVSPVVAQGRLQRVREAVDKPDDKKSSSKDDDDDDDDDSNQGSSGGSDSEEDELGLGAAVGYALISPFALPPSLMGDTYEHQGFFPWFPYADDRPGYMLFEKLAEGEPGTMRRWSSRVEVEAGSNFDDLDRTSLRVMLDTSSRFGLQGRVDYFQERLWCGCTDELYLGSTELTFRFAQCKYMQMHTGLGLRFSDDRYKTNYGFNFTYGADIFPVKPIIISLSMDAGTLGDAELYRGRGTIGVSYRHFEAFTGYDYINIGGVKLDGLLVGLRLWF